MNDDNVTAFDGNFLLGEGQRNRLSKIIHTFIYYHLSAYFSEKTLMRRKLFQERATVSLTVQYIVMTATKTLSAENQ